MRFLHAGARPRSYSGWAEEPTPPPPGTCRADRSPVVAAMNVVTISLLLVVFGALLVAVNIYLFSRASSASTATAKELAARLEIAYSSLQRDIDRLEELRHVDAQQAGAVSVAGDAPIPAVVDCAGAWTSWGPCSQGCGQGIRSRAFVVTVVKHGPGGRDCAQPADAVDSRQCSLSDCADMANSLLNRYCPGATCRGVVDNGYCREPYGHFCATHDALAQPLAPPPGYTVASPGSELCPVSCDTASISAGANNSIPAKPRTLHRADPSANDNKASAVADALAKNSINANTDANSNSGGGSGGGGSGGGGGGGGSGDSGGDGGAAAGMSEADLIAALKAVYPSNDVAAAGNYMGVHDPHVLHLSDALASLRAARVKAAMKWNWDMCVGGWVGGLIVSFIFSSGVSTEEETGDGGRGKRRRRVACCAAEEASDVLRIVTDNCSVTTEQQQQRHSSAQARLMARARACVRFAAASCSYSFCLFFLLFAFFFAFFFFL
jgi:uncharacterized membrane protein YgcG